MKKILLLDPSVSSLNIGDEIIGDGVKKHIDFLLSDSFVIDISSHLPLSFMYKRAIGTNNYAFVCGSNLLMGKMNRLFKQWHIGYKDISFLKGAILIGAGWWQYNNKPNLYTKILYKKILSKKYLHSVRDNYTVEMLKSMGITNVINTGCATMWSLTPEHCKKIPTKKSENVIFTLTDYKPDKEKDINFIKILNKNYKVLYYWPQGIGDVEYFESLKLDIPIKIVNPNLKAYDNILEENEIDFIGTRLHGGIRALQKMKRTIIIAVDNRAKEKQKDFNIVCIERENLTQLEDLINSCWKTEIVIPLENIQKWKNQFSK